MPTRWIPRVKVLVHAACLLPFVWLLRQFQSGALGLNADPVEYLTHFTGDWAVWLLLVSLTVTPLRRLHSSLGNLVRFRRLLGLYAFFYATLHLATYMFLFSGYDLPAAYAGLKAGHPGVLVEQGKLVWPAMLDDLKKRRFIQVGLFAWVLLLALAVTSPVAVLRAMGGRNWQRLHRFVYLAAFAATVHYWWMVKKGNLAPWKDTAVLYLLLLMRVAWWGMKRWRTPPPARVRVSPAS